MFSTQERTTTCWPSAQLCMWTSRYRVWWMLLVEGAFVHSNAFHSFLETRFQILEAEYMRKGISFMPLTKWYAATWAFIESLAL
eukprot:3939023-Rhodomonas_salina.1